MHVVKVREARRQSQMGTPGRYMPLELSFVPKSNVIRNKGIAVPMMSVRPPNRGRDARSLA